MGQADRTEFSGGVVWSNHIAVDVDCFQVVLEGSVGDANRNGRFLAKNFVDDGVHVGNATSIDRGRQLLPSFSVPFSGSLGEAP